MLALERDMMLWLWPPQLTRSRLVSVILFNWVTRWNYILQMRGGCSWGAVELQNCSKTQVQWKLQNSHKIMGNSNNNNYICSLHEVHPFNYALHLHPWSIPSCAVWGEQVTKGSPEVCCTTDFFSSITWLH